MNRIIVAAAAACAAVFALAGPAVTADAAPAHVSHAGFAVVQVNPLFDQAHDAIAVPEVNHFIFELLNDYTYCIVTEGVGNNVKTGNQVNGCAQWTLGVGNYDSTWTDSSDHDLRADNDSGEVITTGESNPDADQNANWHANGYNGDPNPTWTNVKLGGVSWLVSANDAVNSSVYARDHSGDWKFISSCQGC